jgi:hypothetical protein
MKSAPADALSVARLWLTGASAVVDQQMKAIRWMRLVFSPGGGIFSVILVNGLMGVQPMAGQ